MNDFCHCRRKTQSNNRIISHSCHLGGQTVFRCILLILTQQTPTFSFCTMKKVLRMFYAPHIRLPNLRIQQKDWESSEIRLKDRRIWLQNFTQDWGKQNFLRTHKNILCAPKPREMGSDHTRGWAKAAFEHLRVSCRGVVSSGLHGDRRHWQQQYWELHICIRPFGSHQ